MRKKFLALSLAVIVSAAQVMTVSASKQEQLQQQQAAQAETSAQLDNAKAEIDDLETKKNQITGEIDDLDAQLVVTMASVENLKNEIAEKQTEIEDTQKKLSDAQAEEDEQYEQMKKRIKFLYESGGDNGWAALILEGKDLSSILNQAEYTQKLYKYDRECLQEYMDLVQQVTDYSNQLADEKADLEASEAEQEAQQQSLEEMLEQKKAVSDDYENQIADLNDMAAQYNAVLAEQNAKIQQIQEEIAAEEAAKAAQKDPVSLTISVVGDCTLGTDETFDYDTSLNAYYDSNGKDYFFQNVKSIFSADDLTIANFEGTLTDSDTREDKTFAFKAPAEYAQILTSGSIEAVNTANNHSHDYGDQSYTDTLTALDNEGITHFGYDDTAVMDIKGVKVGLVGIYELNDHLGREQQLKDNIAKVKADGAELVIVIFHWGNETETVPDTNQMTLGRLAIDEGADLVCGHHPHVLQGIETYKGKNIVYSLGNFCFGGNSSPSDMDTMIFQQTFTITSDGVQADNVTNIIPCSISSADGYNNYQPTPATGDEATRIKSKIDERSAAIPTADSTAKSSGDTGSSDTVSADEASGNTDTSDESDTSSDFSDESDSSDYDASDEEDYSSDEEADFSDNSEE